MVEDVNKLLEDLGERARADLGESVEVRDQDSFPSSIDSIFSGKIWLRLKDVVAVVVDLKNSTRLSFTKHPSTSARLYEAVTGNCVRIAEKFEADFVDIQGDGLFALFHGEKAYERAMCAAITFKSFSANEMIPAIEDWSEAGDTFPDTGLKVGMHSGVVVVKKIGVATQHAKWQEPVWAGRPVNWAFKCAQKAEANELIATESVYGKFKNNDFVTHSCRCKENPSKLWSSIEVEKLQGTHAVKTMRLTVPWCGKCGSEFCQAILDGETDREEVASSGIE